MNYNKPMHRTAMTAIAAVLAFSSTNLFAQDVTTTQPVAETPVPGVETLAPEPAAPAVSETTPEPASDPLAPAETSTATTATPKKATTTARATPRSTASVARPARTAAPAAAPVAAAEPAAPVETASAAPLLAVPAPVAPEIAPAAPMPVEPAAVEASDDVLPFAGAAAFGLLALLGAGAAVARRKRHAAEADAAADYNEPTFAAAAPAAPVAHTTTPAAREPKPAFGWPGAPRAAVATQQGALPDGMDEASLGHHVAAAYRGPSADNPSLSLKKRLKRAAFFDQRERLARAGKAVAVAPGAGLPAAMAKQAARVRDAVTPRPMSYRPTFQPA